MMWGSRARPLCKQGHYQNEARRHGNAPGDYRTRGPLEKLSAATRTLCNGMAMTNIGKPQCHTTYTHELCRPPITGVAIKTPTSGYTGSG
jgi:hypothetical protein